MYKNKKQKNLNYSFLKKNNKGELSTQQIIMLIILIMSFIVILYFLFRLNLGESGEKEICYNSVVMKANPVLSKGDVSLNCQRTYVCLTKDGSCEAMTNPNIRKVETSDEVYKALADEMADCWWMFGEGTIDYVGDKAKESNYCSICSQIAFDDSMKEIEEFDLGKINQDELYTYLAKTPLSENKETYAEYFFNTKDMELLKTSISENINNSEAIETFGTINLDEQYFVITGITSEIGNTYKWIGGITIGVGVITLPFTGLIAGAIVVSTGIGTVIGGDDLAGLFEPKIAAITVEGDGVENEFMAPTIIEARSETFKLLNCKDILTVA
ncbi:hypothetical protein KAI04_01740 [Candidatus Pacearchaeota archaeon]|nr:hypothetical protein [Candidatus Pacearchaeota archaeon]